MPELPEVETVRRALVPVLERATIVEATITDPRLTRPHDPALVAAELVGETVREVGRRGKYLLWRMTGGRVLVVHLRMTGSLRHGPGGELGDDPHRRAPFAGSGRGRYSSRARSRRIFVRGSAQSPLLGRILLPVSVPRSRGAPRR
jgi:formamidopyrimidine-DNA glycosylase